jgi:hypothetical protein
MRGDFSRETFDPVKHFSRVLEQQGRVHLDADANEASAIFLHYLRSLAADLIGPFAGPDGATGFDIGTVEEGNFTIGPGRYYVDGILCENHEAGIYYLSQKDYPSPPELEQGTAYLVYLDVWERHITALEDDDIREKALGGGDTATRAKIVWQVKLDAPPQSATAASVRKNWPDLVRRWQPAHTGCLRARVDRPEPSTDPCLTAPDARYRGAENQLYRIEIHRGGPAGKATFKWSRNNGSVATRVSMAGTELAAGASRGFTAEQWVELTSDPLELRGVAGTLVKLRDVDSDRFTIESPVPVPPDVADDEPWPTKARAWDHGKTGSAQLEYGAILVTESADSTGWISIENGIQIQFLPAADGDPAHQYRPGDYWLIPARVATGDIEWPREDGDPPRPLPRPPFGIRHHYAPLALLPAAGGVPTDCRCAFLPIKTDCTGAVIPSFGVEGMGKPVPCRTG